MKHRAARTTIVSLAVIPAMLLLASPNRASEPPAPSNPAPTPTAPAPTTPAPSKPAPAKPEPSATAPSAPAPSVKPVEKTPDEVMKDLERKAPAREIRSPEPAQPTLPGSDAGADSRAAAAPGRLLREGSFLAMRKGRMLRGTGSDWVFHFDQEAKSPGDPPMTLMPCMNLMAMEKLAERGGESLTFQVSGQVFVYNGRNYLLPTMYQVNRRSGEVGRK